MRYSNSQRISACPVMNTMKVTDIGERVLIRRLAKLTSTDVSDDCAKLEFGNEYILLTTDTIMRATHIPNNATPYQIGWHIVAINLSDIAACGGRPLGVSVALGLPRDYELSAFEQLVRGMNDCAHMHGTTIIGGDTKENASLTLCGTCVGIVAKAEHLSRRGAEPGDVVCVTGELGRAGAAYHSEDAEALLVITPRLREARTLARTGVVTSCMDISDGLAASLYQLAELNRVGFELIAEQLPIAQEVHALCQRTNMSPDELTLYFGGDYELLLTLDSSRVGAAIDALRPLSTRLTPIGTVTEQREIKLKRPDGKSSGIESRGYEHLADRVADAPRNPHAR